MIIRGRSRLAEVVVSSEELPLVTIAIPVLNEEQHIETCIESLFAGTYPLNRLEVFVLDGGSTDRTVELVEQLVDLRQNIHLLQNPAKIQAVAMNIAIREATGEIIVRLDAHSLYQPDHVERIIERLIAGEAENVGGIQAPVGSGLFGKVAAACLRTSFSMGSSAHRVADNPTYSESVFLGGWRTETLRRLGGFNPAWIVNEDYELNVRLRESGGRVMVLPGLMCEYYVRSTPIALAKQYYRYGFWRVRTVRCHRSAIRPRHLVPLVLLVALVVSLFFAGFGSVFGFIVPVIYSLTLLVAGVRVIAVERKLSAILSPVVFGLIHLSFGFGLAMGCVRWLFRPGECGGTEARS